MSPSGRLCFLTIVSLILPTRGQTSTEATSTSVADPTAVTVHTLTQTPDTVHPDLQPTPQTSALPAAVETTPNKSEKETQTQRLTGTEALLTTDPGTDRSRTEGRARDWNGTTQVLFNSLSGSAFPQCVSQRAHSGNSSSRSTNPTESTTTSKRRSPRKDVKTDPAPRPAVTLQTCAERRLAPCLPPPGSSEDDPFSYDEDTLRKRGLLVAAVLFITGIVILTSGKCRQLPRLCRNYDR
ncbi:PREDICTED: FXYD domain-containing ion transport regulator 5 [Ceratotherium simum simum]|uniref:FXYD domain-containing ion transport regulator n=1 Tax=Ceratotherium simum simum TaxID=73337 RepID=A0ABM1DEI8_CERSS|nr:PREDICTED: FXYD domain-containing ion transport regulator 5 [Ceratotherium simum simum]